MRLSVWTRVIQFCMLVYDVRARTVLVGRSSLPSLAVVPAQAIVAEGVYRSKHRVYGVAQVAQRHRLGPPSEDRWGGSKRTRRRPVAVATADPPVPHLLHLLLLLLLLFLLVFFFQFRPSLLSSRAMPAAVPSAEEPGKAALRRPLRSHPAQLDHLVLVQVVLLIAQCQDVLPSPEGVLQGAVPAGGTPRGRARFSPFAARHGDARGTAMATESRDGGHASAFGQTRKKKVTLRDETGFPSLVFQG